jgi:uncharacterized damage-inducible protein DinB
MLPIANLDEVQEPRLAMGSMLWLSRIVLRHPVTEQANKRFSSKTKPEVQRMTKSGIAAARLLEIWQYMQDELVRVIAPLSEEQMNARIAPDQRTVGELAEHIVRGRALWVHEVLGDPSLEPMMSWDEPDDPPRSAGEVVAGLQHTWQILRGYIEPSTADDPGPVPEQEQNGLRIVWGMLDHDLPHAGQLALMLGSLGLETPDF